MQKTLVFNNNYVLKLHFESDCNLRAFRVYVRSPYGFLQETYKSYNFPTVLKRYFNDEEIAKARCMLKKIKRVGNGSIPSFNTSFCDDVKRTSLILSLANIQK